MERKKNGVILQREKKGKGRRDRKLNACAGARGKIRKKHLRPTALSIEVKKDPTQKIEG